MQALESSRMDHGSATVPRADLPEEDFRLETIGAGDRQAFELLCLECYGPLAHFLSLLLPTIPTRDLCEEVFMEVWNSASAGPSNLTAMTLVLSIGLRRAAACHSSGQLPTAGDSRFTFLGESQVREELRRKLAELPWEQRVVASLVYGMGLPLQTISQITAMSEQEICGHLSGARQGLRPRPAGAFAWLCTAASASRSSSRMRRHRP
jgi:DNA-directed RNA polymerase specialized sigma24 family protein